ncbi:hypothetical protein GC173_15445 [bacterium]|nr:hypothetical protein [bacterium]
MEIDETKRTEVYVEVDFVPSVPDGWWARHRDLVTKTILPPAGILLGVCTAGFFPPATGTVFLALIGLLLLHEPLSFRHWFLGLGRQQIADLIQAGRNPLEAYAIASRTRPTSDLFWMLGAPILYVLSGAYLRAGFSMSFLVILLVFILALTVWRAQSARKHPNEVRVSAADLGLLMPDKYPLEAMERVSSGLLVTALLIANLLPSLLSFVVFLTILLLATLIPRLRARTWRREPMTTGDRLSRMIGELVELR